uniref:Serine hydrolase domain-containing protein n=1 Tax=Polytomella parva TaxID=51329 RepID=A0A7S0UTR4_9CHLO|mmetsp:Transcript_21667/g.38700  ORF Transcript_21667/g.38700 Transcript_21667/m.38700 type:complete len:322 (+) Transcript_21667:143-1108(+)|eukprot:CAMPEP_0175045302 /NCGR_PEP_ID=MMETSP0052_2-20121109/4331_1 /TAXON_ID=51329 ORGANISM="Polytomella parva, Strain SAG 63-3" /NCGR_SAMPLE_ID=MMETSP0052_2 /ASSEMBLY_ACC=CAM_ASM_000194 /LENGTH=321 /DNA_ID=CAMNT_0016308785 /DNA_START=104 /DNA_END=1069 /DNA_ORIENTATION=-
MALPKSTILCLHGYTQNSEVFRARIGSIRKALKSRADFIFLNGPFPAKQLPGQSEAVQGGLSWWDWEIQSGGTPGRPAMAALYRGWFETTAPMLLSALREHRPDGLLGFSQGATALAFLLAEVEFFSREGYWRWEASELRGGGGGREQEGEKEEATVTEKRALDREVLGKLRYAIMVAGFLPRDASFASFLSSQRPSLLNCLFVSGASDALVPRSNTSTLLHCFCPDRTSSFTHAGSHLVPTCSGSFKSALLRVMDPNVEGSGEGGAKDAIRAQSFRPFHIEGEGLEGKGVSLDPEILREIERVEADAKGQSLEDGEGEVA